MTNSRVIITGCARSGTTFMTKVLQASGLDFVHERHFGRHGIVSWGYFDSPRKAIHFNRHESLEQSTFPKFMQIRDPQKVCNSIRSVVDKPHASGFSSWGYIEDILPEVKLTKSPEEKTVIYWTLWNHKLLEHVNSVYNIKNSYRLYSTVCNMFAVNPMSLSDYNNFETKKINTRNNPHSLFDHSKYIPSSIRSEYDTVITVLEKS